MSNMNRRQKILVLLAVILVVSVVSVSVVRSYEVVCNDYKNNCMNHCRQTHTPEMLENHADVEEIEVCIPRCLDMC